MGMAGLYLSGNDTIPAYQVRPDASGQYPVIVVISDRVTAQRRRRMPGRVVGGGLSTLCVPEAPTAGTQGHGERGRYT